MSIIIMMSLHLISNHQMCPWTLHVLIALNVAGYVQVCLRFAVGGGLSGVCMFHVLIMMFILVLNCEVL